MTPPHPSSHRQDSFSERHASHSRYDASDYSEYSYSRSPPRNRIMHTQRHHVAPSFTDYTLSRPSTALSFTTRSSELASTQQYDASGSNMSTISARLRSPSPVTQSLPSPPQDSYSTTQAASRSSSRIYSPILSTQPNSSRVYSPIPSAQPNSPIEPLSPHIMSSSGSTSMLPSPPLTQPRHNYFPTTTSSPVSSPPQRRTPRQPPVPQRHIPGSFPPDPDQRRPVRQYHAPGALPSEADDEALFASVFDGIAQLSVAMKKDDAGRWRIQRTGDASPDGI